MHFFLPVVILFLLFSNLSFAYGGDLHDGEKIVVKPVVKSAEIVRPTLEIFHGRECPHCHRQAEWLPVLHQMYPSLQIIPWEVWHNSNNQKKMDAKAKELGVPATGVPYNVIGNQIVISGFSAEGIKTAMKEIYGDPVIEESEVDREKLQPLDLEALEKGIGPGNENNLLIWVISVTLLVVLGRGLISLSKK